MTMCQQSRHFVAFRQFGLGRVVVVVVDVLLLMVKIFEVCVELVYYGDMHVFCVAVRKLGFFSQKARKKTAPKAGLPP